MLKLDIFAPALRKELRISIQPYVKKSYDVYLLTKYNAKFMEIAEKNCTGSSQVG
jgi:hypothetical protein